MTTRLEIRTFGPRQAPEWMNDRERMVEWVTADAGWPRMWDYTGYQKITEAQFDETHRCSSANIAPDGVETGASVESGLPEHQPGLPCWSYEDEDQFHFGWGCLRIRIQKTEAQRITIRIDQWRSTGWRDDEVEPGFFHAMFGIKMSNQNAWLCNFDPAKLSYRNAPWSNLPYFHGGAYFYRAHHHGVMDFTDAPSTLENLDASDRVHFRAWLNYQLRRAARRWPYLKMLALPSFAGGKPPSYAALCLLVHKLETDGQWQQHPLDWLVTHAIEPEAYNLRPWNEARAQQAHFYIHGLPLLLKEKESYPIEAGNLIGLDTLRWMQQLPTHHMARIMQRQTQEKRTLVGLLAWAAGVEAMKEAKLTGVSARHMEHAASIPTKILLLSYRLSHIEEIGEGLWRERLVEKILSEDDLAPLKEIKDFEQANPIRARALKCAVISKMKAPLSQSDSTIDSDTWQVLAADRYLTHSDWHHVNSGWAWKTFVRMAQKWQRATLAQAHQHDLGERNDSVATMDATDPSWHSALGHVRWSGVTVTPICRFSQLKLMGDYFFNCLRATTPTADFVAEAVENRFRYFRLEHNEQRALLHLHREETKQEWQVRQLYGLANTKVNDTLQAAAQRVAEVYSMLESDTSLMAAIKDEGGPRP